MLYIHIVHILYVCMYVDTCRYTMFYEYGCVCTVSIDYHSLAGSVSAVSVPDVLFPTSLDAITMTL